MRWSPRWPRSSGPATHCGAPGTSPGGFRWKALGLWVIALALLAGLVIGAGILAAGVEALLGKGEVLNTVVVAFVSLLFYPLLSSLFTLFFSHFPAPTQPLALRLL